MDTPFDFESKQNGGKHMLKKFRVNAMSGQAWASKREFVGHVQCISFVVPAFGKALRAYFA